jgi:hypothetical protein
MGPSRPTTLRTVTDSRTPVPPVRPFQTKETDMNTTPRAIRVDDVLWQSAMRKSRFTGTSISDIVRDALTSWVGMGSPDVADGDVTIDQHESGQSWSVTRYGTLVVVTVGDQDGDIQFADVPTAIAEFESQVEAFRNLADLTAILGSDADARIAAGAGISTEVVDEP